MRQIDESKLGVVRNDHLRTQWAKRHPVCQLRFDAPHSEALQTHHIAQAAGRSDEVCNFLRTCQYCHDMIHAGLVSFETVVAAKAVGDPDEFSLCRVLRLKGMAFSPELLVEVAREVKRMMGGRN